MSDDKQGQNDNVEEESRPQPDRNREADRDRGKEERAMDGDPDERLGELDNALESQEYPATTEALVEAYGDYDIETQHGSESLENVLASTDDQTFVSADDVRSRILGLVHR